MNFLTRFEKWDPFTELNTLRNRMDRLMARYDTDEVVPAGKWMPSTDILDTKDALILRAELPGIEEKDLVLEVANGILTFEGERKMEKETEEYGYQRVERNYGRFFRSFTLPPNVDPKLIAAKFYDGVLEIRLPKTEASKPNRIPIETKTLPPKVKAA